jgi:hypothetical protein
MQEVFIERKTVIETVHFSNHTPLYIETEPMVKDERARQTMLSLLSDADGLISIHYLSEGRPDIDLLQDHTPIEFELLEFCKLHPQAPIILFRKSPDQFVTPSPRMLDFFNKMASRLGVEVVEFKHQRELQVKLSGVLRQYQMKVDDTNPDSRVTIRYMGPDFMGLVNRLSEVLFTRYKLNIDYISHAAAGGHSTVCVSCSPRLLPGTPDTIDPRHLEAELLTELEAEILQAAGENRLVNGADLHARPEVIVDIDDATLRRRKFYVIVRAIDAPGQLNAICKELLELRFNIDELQLRPTAPEYPRQTTITMWLSRDDTRDDDLRLELDAIEGALQYLVGVRAFSIRAMPPESHAATSRGTLVS